MIVGVAMGLNLRPGRTLKRGAYIVGDGITAAEAKTVLSNPRWGRKIEKSEIPVFGGLVGSAKAPANKFPDVPVASGADADAKAKADADAKAKADADAKAKADADAKAKADADAKAKADADAKAKADADAKAKADADAKAKADADAKLAALPALNSDDATLKAGLSVLNKADMDAYWDAQDEEVMAVFLVERVGRERKQWNRGMMGNMIQNHLGIPEPVV